MTMAVWGGSAHDGQREEEEEEEEKDEKEAAHAVAEQMFAAWEERQQMAGGDDNGEADEALPPLPLWERVVQWLLDHAHALLSDRDDELVLQSRLWQLAVAVGVGVGVAVTAVAAAVCACHTAPHLTPLLLSRRTRMHAAAVVGTAVVATAAADAVLPPQLAVWLGVLAAVGALVVVLTVRVRPIRLALTLPSPRHAVCTERCILASRHAETRVARTKQPAYSMEMSLSRAQTYTASVALERSLWTFMHVL
jgi:hypothetical protein